MLRQAPGKWMTETARQAAWAPIMVFLAHVIAVHGFDAYARFPALDIPMHLGGGAAIAYFFHCAIRNGERLNIIGNLRPVGRIGFVFALVCTASVFWEFAEYINDHVFGGHAQIGLEDTMGDLLCGVLGGIAYLAGRHLHDGRKSP